MPFRRVTTVFESCLLESQVHPQMDKEIARYPSTCAFWQLDRYQIVYRSYTSLLVDIELGFAHVLAETFLCRGPADESSHTAKLLTYRLRFQDLSWELMSRLGGLSLVESFVPKTLLEPFGP